MVNLMQVLQKEWAVVSESDLLEGLIWKMHETEFSQKRFELDKIQLNHYMGIIL